jgi:CheY-like chemotaxis protein
MANARKILLVTGDPAAAKNLGESFSGKGISVVAVETAEEALWRLEGDGFSAILSETRLRGMSGQELAEELGERGSSLPFFQLPQSAEKLAEIAEQLQSAPEPAAAAATAAQPRAAAGPRSRLKDVVLFLLGPVFALGYIIVFPVVGLGMLIISAFEAKPATEAAEAQPAAEAPKSSLLKALGMLLAVVVVGVFYGLVAPFMGIVLVVWFGLEAWTKLGARAIGAGRS